MIVNIFRITMNEFLNKQKSKSMRFFLKGILSIMLYFFVLLIAASTPSFAEIQVNSEVPGMGEVIASFLFSISEYYLVPEKEVEVVYKRGFHEEELPVVFLIAQRAHASPEVVADLRLKGMNWMDITTHYGLSPEIYYVPVRTGPPYGHAYGYYNKHSKGGWHRDDLEDADIVNQVNLKFISEHHKYAPEKVMEYRSEGKSFTIIDRDIKQVKQGKPQGQEKKKSDDDKQNDNNQKDTNQGQGPDKGNGKKMKDH
jgi:hypothetical protein